MIREIRLENFKAFGSEQRIPIKPITLIYGANSSGKSTILNAILLQKQTYEESSHPYFSLLFKGSYTDQQNYSRCINGRDVNKKLKIGIGYDSALEHKFNFSENKKLFINHTHSCYNVESIEYKTNDVDICKLVRVERNKLFYDLEDLEDLEGIPAEYLDKIPDEYRRESSLYRKLHFFSDDNAPKHWLSSKYFKFDLTVISDEFVQELHNRLIKALKNDNPECQGDSVFTNISCSLFKSKLLEYMDNIVFIATNGLPIYFTTIKDYVGKLTLKNGKQTSTGGDWGAEYRQHKDIFNRIADYIIESTSQYKDTMGEIVYLGPLRKRPERFAEQVNECTASVGNDGEYTTARITDNPYALNDINAWLLKLGMNYEIRVHKTSGDDQIAFGDINSIQIIEKSSGIPLTLCDVGFGISQILPILVQSLMFDSKTILIEQPEIHLHPKMQAELGDFFISLAKSSSSQKQFIIETHSEHLLLRIMRRMRATFNGTLEEGLLPVTPDDVSLIYVQPTDSGSIIRVLELDAEGRLLDPWPGGFFEEGFKERFA